jgi:hypothetical protein
MEIRQIWKKTFERWPQDLPQRGIVTTTLEEQIPFKGYMLSGEAVLLERANPDPLGTRFIILPYDNMAAIKLVDVIKEKTFSAMGFEGKLSAK